MSGYREIRYTSEDGLDLYARDYRIVAPDQRGRGQSQWDSNPGNYTPARYVADMFTLIARIGLRRIVPIGTCMGGLMAMMMAVRRPELFRGVVLNDIGPEISPAGLARSGSGARLLTKLRRPTPRPFRATAAKTGRAGRVARTQRTPQASCRFSTIRPLPSCSPSPATMPHRPLPGRCSTSCATCRCWSFAVPCRTS